MKNKKSYKERYFKNLEKEGYLFISLWLIGFIVFRIYPFASSFIYSFSDLNLFKGAEKWGFMNYERIFSDEKIIKSFKITFLYTFLTVPLKILTALIVAILLSGKIKMIGFFRTVYYIPSILGSSVAVSVLWKAIFRDDGIINLWLESIGIEAVSWLSDPSYSIFVISWLRIWQYGSAMVVFLAALQSVPKELYEAAVIDGAGKIKCFFTITLPFLTPVIFFNIIMQLCQTMQEFNAPFVITQGGPRNSTALISLTVYNTAFQLKNLGLASAITWVLFAIISFLAIILFMSQKYWVYYNGRN